MLFDIEHYTRYDYSVPVQLGEQLLRFLPREERQQTLYSDIEISPSPHMRVREPDPWGNWVERVQFAGETSHLEIRARLQVSTAPAPSTAALAPLPLPLAYNEQHASLAPYLVLLEQPEHLQAFIDPLLQQGQHLALPFLERLNEEIHRFYHKGVRLKGNARSPVDTLRRGEGVCRDLAMLFMAACRQVGLATRFVSGYQQGAGQSEGRQLHAWAEVYLPSLGWIGYDPTHGAQTGEEHLAVAAAPEQSGTMPLSGNYTFMGEKLTSTLTTEIHITTDY